MFMGKLWPRCISSMFCIFMDESLKSRSILDSKDTDWAGTLLCFILTSASDWGIY